MISLTDTQLRTVMAVAGTLDQDKRIDAQFCSSGCKQRSHRRRKLSRQI